MMKEYKIPHNFSNNGRICNMVGKQALVKILMVLVPITLIIFNLPLKIDDKFFYEILIGAPPTALFALEMDLIFWDMIQFHKNKKIYYNLGGVKTEEYKTYKSAYEQKKEQQCNQHSE